MIDQTALLSLLSIPLVAAPFIYLVGRLGVRQPDGSARAARWAALLTLLASLVSFYFVAESVLANGPLMVFVGSVSLRMDGIGLVLSGAALLLGLLVLIYSFAYMRGEEGEEKYFALLPALIGTIVGLGCANDLFNLWVWFEAMAISSYLLVAFYTHEKGALEAGFKYLVQSAVGSVLVLIGIALVLAQTSTIQLDLIATASGLSRMAVLAMGALFLVGFGVKTALVPLHTWLPDAHSQAPSGISALLSGVVIEAGLVAMLRALGCLPGGLPVWGQLLLLFGALNMLFGNLMALRQTEIKRMLAYSSLSHIGYMLVGFGAAAAFQAEAAAAGGFFHLFTHAMMKGLAFLAVGALLYAIHISRGSHAPLVVDDLTGAAQKYPLTVFCLSVALLALGGLPPMAGFMSKWQIFAGAAATQNLPVLLLVVFAALNSVLSLGYYAPLVNRMYRRVPGAAINAAKPVSRWMVAPLVVLAALVVVLGFLPGLMNGWTGPAARAFLDLFALQNVIAVR